MTTTNRYDAIVIGAGANGLAAAAALGGFRRRVLVLEGAEAIGGTHRLLEITPGFSAPLHLEPGWIPPWLARGLSLRKIGTNLPDVSVSVRHDGEFLSIPRDPVAAQTAIRRYSSHDADRWPMFTARLRRLSNAVARLYRAPTPDGTDTSFGNMASLTGVATRLRALGRDDFTEFLRSVPMPIQDFLDDALESDGLKAAIGAGAVRDMKHGPRAGGTTFALLHHLAGAPSGSVRARRWPRTSPTAFIDAAHARALKRNVQVRCETEVVRILVRDGAVTGVVLANGDEVLAPIVVSTADARRTLLQLTDTVWLDPELLHALTHVRFHGCTAIIQYALDRLPEAKGLSREALAGVVSLSPSLDRIERASDAVKYDVLSDAPHIEFSIPSLRWPALAPEGRHVAVARVQYVPRDFARDELLAEDTISAIDTAIPGFHDAVLRYRVTLPRDLARDFALADGALDHGELALDQVFYMRPVGGLAHYETPITGLFLGGAGCHPGPGILGGAGWLAARAARRQ